MKVAAIQADVAFGKPEHNGLAAIAFLEKLANRVNLAVFPECFLTGYAARSEQEARQIAIDRNHPALEAIWEAAERFDVGVVIGFAEIADDKLFNTAALFIPGEEPRFYRKTHLPFMGYDRFAVAGDALPVFDTKYGKLGILICYDQRPSEPARVMALQGADLILLPTNWPDGAQVSASAVCICRAAESKVWFVACNRCGNENGFRFIGQSKIISPTGKVLEAAGEGEAVLIADIDLAAARQKRTVLIPGEYELEVMSSRRPELYGSLGS